MSSMLIVKETIDNDFGGWAIAGQILKGQLISEWNFGVVKSPKKQNQILNRFLPYEARAEICQKFGWLFGRFEDTKISVWD